MKQLPRLKIGKVNISTAWLGLLIFFGIGLIVYASSPHIIQMSDTTAVNADGGKFEITYAAPISMPFFKAVGFNSEVSLSDDQRSEIHTLVQAPFNRDMHFERIGRESDSLFSFDRLPKTIPFHTAKEKVRLVRTIPAMGSQPTPESMDNQIVLQFQGSVIHNFKKGENISIEKMDVVRLTPQTKGYYRWNSPSQLAFNFTEDAPQFNTTYRFDVDLEKLIDSKTQEWVGEEPFFEIITASNEVFIKEYSLNGKVHWRSPLRIEFSGNMVGALDVLKMKSQSIIPIDIEPRTPGAWRWINARTIEFVLDTQEGWPTRQNVKVTVHPQINQEPDRSWRGGDQPVTHSFYVLPRKQSIVSYDLRGDQVALDKDLHVRFSRAMYEKDALPQPFLNEGDGASIPLIITPKIAGKFIWSSPDSLAFHPDNLWSELKEYKVSLNPKFNPDSRYEWTGIDHFMFKTVENLVTYKTFATPENSLASAKFFSNPGRYKLTDPVLPEERLWIFFDQSIGRFMEGEENLESLLEISPKIKGKAKWLSHQLLEFVPDDNWSEETTYQVSLSKRLLHHPEQHFRSGRETFKFTSGKNRVRSRMGESTLPDKSYAQAVETPLTIDFSKNMNPMIKVGKKYRLSELSEGSPVQIVPSLDCELYWEDSRTLQIIPSTYWAPETDYVVSLNPAILPQRESQFDFTPEIHLRTGKNIFDITSFTPTGKVGKRIVIDAQFSKMIKPESLPLGAKDPYSLFSIEPAIKGDWIWLADNKMQFKPVDPLPSSTEFTVSFFPNHVPDKQFSWRSKRDEQSGLYRSIAHKFHTEALHVQSANARFEFNEKDLLKQRFYLDIVLSEPVQASELRKRFSIWFNKVVDGKRVEVPLLYTLQNRSGKTSDVLREFSVVSDWIERPANDRRIYYKILKWLDPIQGNLKMDSDYASDFLQEKPKHIRITSGSFAWQGSHYDGVLSLSAPVNPEKLQQFLMVKSGDKVMEDITVSIHPTGAQGQFNYLITGDFQPEQKYDFSISQGLLAEDGAFVVDDIHLSSQPPGLQRKLDFALNGNFLSRHDLAKVPLVSTNFDKVQLRIEKIYANNLNYFLNQKMNRNDIRDVAKEVYNQFYEIKDLTGSDQHNREVITHIDMRKMFTANRHGLYRITASGRNHRMQTSRWFLSTDIGLVSRQFNNRLLVWANSLHTNAALNGVNIECYDRWNQLVKTVHTDKRGFAEISLPKGSQVMHLIARTSDDMSFLNLQTHHELLSQYDVEGVSSEQSVLRSYIYSDRGVYRPGDQAHLVAVTRQKEGRLPTNFPVTFRLTNPVGKHEVTERYQLDSTGAYLYDYNIPAEAPTGKWHVTTLWNDVVIGSYSFQVEEFIPNKIKVTLESLNPSLHAGETLRFKVKGRNLFGPPSANRRVNGSINLRAVYFKPKGYEVFKFGHEDIRFQRIDTELLETKLDDQGEYIYEYTIPDGINSPIGLSAHYSATVIDDGGRGVSAYGSSNVQLFTQYVGIRKLSRDSAGIGQPVGFEVVNVAADGESVERNQQQLDMRVYLNKEVAHYRKNERGHFRYVREKVRVLVQDLNDPRDEQGKLTYTADAPGEYILEVEDKVGGQVTRHHFYVTGPLVSTQKVLERDKVDLRILTGDVMAGGEVRVEVRSPFAGKVLLAGEREKVLFTRVIEIGAAAKTVSFPVPASYLPNFYISATATRAVPDGDRDHSVYATGLVNVDVKDRSHSPAIHLEAPSRVSPNGKMHVRLKVDNTNRSAMYFTIAAVDVGILDLTKFELPSMKNVFYHKRKLEVGHYSMYPMVMPYEPEVKYVVSPSGGAPSRALIKKKRVNPTSQKRVKSVALWSGLLKLDEKGMGEVTLDIPDFDGTLRVMAVAFGNQRFASTQKEVLVRDNLVVKSTLPRFMATGDRFSIPIKLFNGTDMSGQVKLTLITSDHVKLLGSNSRSLSMATNSEEEISFAAEVMPHMGIANIEIIAEGVGEITRKQIHVPVRSPGTMITLSESGYVDKLSPKSITFPDRFVEGSQELAMKISARQLDRFGNSLSWLLQYPHGCLEQTTSRVFPLLYYGDMVDEKVALTNEAKSHYYLKEGIAKIGRMQLNNGAFSYWQGGHTVNNWAFVYSAHFLVEAQKAGWSIDKTVWNNMLHYLSQSVASMPDSHASYRMDYYLYGLYVLARAGENVLARINTIYDRHLSQLKPHEKARLAVAFFESGMSDTAQKILTDLGDFSPYTRIYRNTGGSFASNVRDLAIILDAWSTVNPKSLLVTELVGMLTAQARNGYWGTTQENAYALLALGKAYRNEVEGKAKIEVTLGNGSKMQEDSAMLLQTPELLSGEVRIEVSGEGQAVYTWEAVGIDKAPTSLQEDKGIKVRRRYLDKDGKEQKLDEINQGELVVVELKMQALDTHLENIVITDLLPMGLEVENFRLSTSASLPWVRSDIQPEHVDMRDDRINIYLNLPVQEKTYYYTTRAVTTGQFTVPAVRGEAMYDPDIYSESGRGNLRIQGQEGRTQFGLALE